MSAISHMRSNSHPAAAQLADARAAHKYVRRAVAVATFDGWTVAVFAIATACAAWAAFPAWSSAWPWAASLISSSAAHRSSAASINPRRGDWASIKSSSAPSRRLRHLADLSGIARASPYAALSQADAHMGKRFEDMARSLTVGVYGCLIIFAIVAQGGAALFYFTREKYLKDYRQRTPAWILQMQQTGVAV